MTGSELISLFKQGGKRCLVIGTFDNGIIAGLDLEGRLYAVMDGVVLNRVNPAAITGISTRAGYLNPGGDGLWAAPEGTAMGYQYATGNWRVSPGLTGARFLVTAEDPGHAVMEAEIDLINARGTGLPTIFRRDITVASDAGRLTVKVIESIRYLGSKPLSRAEVLLAPWSLCQFDCGPGCEVVFPADHAEIRDLYDPSENCRFEKNGLVHTRTDGTQRYQIGLGKGVPWIELRKPAEYLTVRRSASPLVPGQSYIDIADALPTVAPLMPGARYSVYSDAGGFMEIEAAGGMPAELLPETELLLEITTEYRKTNIF